METLGTLNWLAIGICVILGQIFLTVWFVALFGQPWAEAYGAADKKAHAKEVPGYTYGIGLACMILLTVGLAVLQAKLGVRGVASGLLTGAYVAVTFAVATALPGYAFLKRYNAGILAIGSQACLILVLSVVLSIWPA